MACPAGDGANGEVAGFTGGRRAYSPDRSWRRYTDMARVATARKRPRQRKVLFAVGVALLVLILISGILFASSLSVTRVTNNARSLHWVNATTGTSALVRAGLAQAVTFGALLDEGTVSATDYQFALDQAEAAHVELDRMAEAGEGHDSYGDLARYVGQVEATLGRLQDGDVAEARQTMTTSLESAYIDLSDALAEEQAATQEAIDANSDTGRAINGWIVFALTLAVPGTAVIVYFVIARRQMRALRERTRVEVEAERAINKAKDDFIAGLSHELRTPLTSIYGFAEIIADGEISGPEATRETAQVMATEAAEMTRMVDDLLAASRLQSIGLEVEVSPTPINDVIEAALTPFNRAEVGVKWEPTEALAMADAARLRHVLVNLISNAARHGGPERGIDVSSTDDDVSIEVWDTGAGVNEDGIETLFERFVHDGDAPLLTGSVGLGLAVAWRIVDLMGGKLEYQRFGGRTYFVVTLPVATSAPGSDGGSVAEMIRVLSS